MGPLPLAPVLSGVEINPGAQAQPHLPSLCPQAGNYWESIHAHTKLTKKPATFVRQMPPAFSLSRTQTHSWMFACVGRVTLLWLGAAGGLRCWCRRLCGGGARLTRQPSLFSGSRPSPNSRFVFVSNISTVKRSESFYYKVAEDCFPLCHPGALSVERSLTAALPPARWWWVTSGWAGKTPARWCFKRSYGAIK